MDINLTVNQKQDVELAILAYNYANQNFSHNEIISNLSIEDEIKKAICLINLDFLQSQAEADALLSNLTGKGTLIREITSDKLLKLIQNDQYRLYFQSEQILDKFLMATVDINPSVSRNIVSALSFIENKAYFLHNLKEKIFYVLNEIDNIPSYKSSKSYNLNKKIFALYWYLVALNVVTKSSLLIDKDSDFERIIERCSEQNEYTIREKVAKILSEIDFKNNDKLVQIFEKLKADENFYVRFQTLKSL